MADQIDNQPAAGDKKTYSAPRLVVYGDLRTITENMRRSGNDGGSAGSNFSV
jgi:hypothetical protein